MDKENAEKEIAGLVEKYREILEENGVHEYNEARAENEFIESLFEALGWNVRNKTYKDEVTMEENVSKRRVDYASGSMVFPCFS
jgi:predicted type IV restriction endonuclease